MAKKKVKTVYILVEGGVIQDVCCPEGVEVEVRDYDVEGDDLMIDDNEDLLKVSTWYYDPDNEDVWPNYRVATEDDI